MKKLTALLLALLSVAAILTSCATIPDAPIQNNAIVAFNLDTKGQRVVSVFFYECNLALDELMENKAIYDDEFSDYADAVLDAYEIFSEDFAPYLSQYDSYYKLTAKAYEEATEWAEQAKDCRGGEGRAECAINLVIDLAYVLLSELPITEEDMALIEERMLV